MWREAQGELGNAACRLRVRGMAAGRRGTTQSGDAARGQRSRSSEGARCTVLVRRSDRADLSVSIVAAARRVAPSRAWRTGRDPVS